MPIVLIWCSTSNMSKLVPAALLRNLRHPAHNQNPCFDDHEVSVLLSLFVRLEGTYKFDPDPVISACWEAFQWIREDKCNVYDGSKDRCGQNYTQATRGDIQHLFVHFSRTADLRSWCERAEACMPKLQALTCKVVKPVIKSCIFCKQDLHETIRRVSGKGAAKNGGAWAYDYNTGASVMIVCKSTCMQCSTEYNFQTYTPGESILEHLGEMSTLTCVRKFKASLQFTFHPIPIVQEPLLITDNDMQI